MFRVKGARAIPLVGRDTAVGVAAIDWAPERRRQKNPNNGNNFVNRIAWPKPQGCDEGTTLSMNRVYSPRFMAPMRVENLTSGLPMNPDVESAIASFTPFRGEGEEARRRLIGSMRKLAAAA
jgi:hypothetical protein